MMQFGSRISGQFSNFETHEFREQILSESAFHKSNYILESRYNFSIWRLTLPGKCKCEGTLKVDFLFGNNPNIVNTFKCNHYSDQVFVFAGFRLFENYFTN